MSDTLSFWIVKGTFALLVGASALTWTVVIAKAFQQWRLASQNRGFAKTFGKVSRLPSAADLTASTGPVARVALAGAEAWEESARTVGNDADQIDVRRDLLERSLRQQVQRERHGVEAGLPILASIGTTAPFVGLFGTVFGIIHALVKISGSGSASLDVVAGPIGEALVATGIGIAVAVPAVLAYNLFLRRLKNLLAEIEDFANTFVNSAVKSSFRKERSGEHSIHQAVSLRRDVSVEASA